MLITAVVNKARNVVEQIENKVIDSKNKGIEKDLLKIHVAILNMDRSEGVKVLVEIDQLGLTEILFNSLVKSVGSNKDVDYLPDSFFNSFLVNWTDLSEAVCLTLINGKKAIPFYINRLKNEKIPQTEEEKAQIRAENEDEEEEEEEEEEEAVEEAEVEAASENDDDNESYDYEMVALECSSSESLDSYLTVVHNLAKHSESWHQFHKLNATDVLKRFLAYPQDDVQMTTLCAMASLLRDTEKSSSLADEYDVIPKLVKCLEMALDEEGDYHRYNGFSAEELAQSLTHLAVNDNNKKIIAKAGAIELFASMLQGNDETEQERAIDCLWALSFDDSIRKDVHSMTNIDDSITKIGKEAKNEELRTKANLAKDFIKVGKQGMAETGRPKSVKPKSKDADDKGHIFISYNWKHQEIVLKIRQFLLDKGFKVWMDVDNMTNNTLEAMASGVEQAKLVLICYSEHYKQSNMCRTEAEYVFRLGKPFIPINLEYRYFPTGWLGIIIGARLYVDFSLHKHTLEVVFGRLDNEMNSILSKQGDIDEDPASKLEKSSHDRSPGTTQMSSTNVTNHDGPFYSLCPCCDSEILMIPFGDAAHPFTPKKEIGKKIVKWTPKDVNKWVQSEGFSKGVLANFDGSSLIGFFNMKQSVSFTLDSSTL